MYINFQFLCTTAQSDNRSLTYIFIPTILSTQIPKYLMETGTAFEGKTGKSQNELTDLLLQLDKTDFLITTLMLQVAYY